MCWVGKGEELTPKYAKENVSIIKVLRCLAFNKEYFLASPYHFYNYELFKHYHHSELQLNKPGKEGSIYEGFHCYDPTMVVYSDDKYPTILHIYLAGPSEKFVSFYGRNYRIVKGYIPKGTRYYLNNRGEIVTEQIVLTEIVDRLCES